MTCGKVMIDRVMVGMADEAISYAKLASGQRRKIEFLLHTFFNRLVANISTSVSTLKLCTAPRYPTFFCIYLGDDMTSRTWNEAQDMSCPNISKYISFSRAVALMSVCRNH